ncbi:hypothetical protein MLD38_013079 [Melastoma candidum]|uniref:Uncharacterized protein n=1 Tax=Melastoma candidum TaxID=119954 RepID=A0ACB9R8D3_9MYRT|nr:hypothetical protein MLD38_013079 [Melastoma candidum]
MGCIQTRPSSSDSPPNRLEKLKQESGYFPTGNAVGRGSGGGNAYNRTSGPANHRRSTGQRYFEEDPAVQQQDRPPTRRYHSGNLNGKGTGRGSSNGGIAAGTKNGRTATTATTSSGSGGGSNPKRELLPKQYKDDDAVDHDGNDDGVNGWPKWLMDHVPMRVLEGLVPKSADSYDKIDKVGQGTYSNVYKARDRETGKLVALKKVRFDTSEPESIKFMAREIKILRELDHPNIVKLEGLATSRMQFSIYLVFDFMQSDLQRIITRPDERLTEPQIKYYMNQLLSGLQHCHERGILHRDIKGANLLIDRNGVLKIADFGLANYYRPGGRRPLTNRVVTLWYRAPELLLGATDYGIGIDLWSAGCLLAEMFAGHPIMPGRTEVEQLHRIFKLCGTPQDDYWKKVKLPTTFRPKQTYKPSIIECFKEFPDTSVGLLSTLLALDPAYRGTASIALQHEFFSTEPLACDPSGLPVFSKLEEEFIKPKSRRHSKGKRSKAQRERRRQESLAKKSAGETEPTNDQVEEKAIVVASNGMQEPGSSTSSNSSRAKASQEGRSPPPPASLSPVASAYWRLSSGVSPDGIEQRDLLPPLPVSRANRYVTENSNGLYRLYQVGRSASTREFGNAIPRSHFGRAVED